MHNGPTFKVHVLESHFLAVCDNRHIDLFSWPSYTGTTYTWLIISKRRSQSVFSFLELPKFSSCNMRDTDICDRSVSKYDIDVCPCLCCVLVWVMLIDAESSYDLQSEENKSKDCFHGW